MSALYERLVTNTGGDGAGNGLVAGACFLMRGGALPAIARASMELACERAWSSPAREGRGMRSLLVDGRGREC